MDLNLNPVLENLTSKTSTSELTIYKNDVENQINKRVSSSSEEGEAGNDTSDENILEPMEVELLPPQNTIGRAINQRASNDFINDFITDVRDRHRRGDVYNGQDEYSEWEPQPTSTCHQDDQGR